MVIDQCLLSCGVMNRTEFFQKIIIKWWKERKRTYPWRKTSDPYLTLITEILLRKTTATHVNSIYDAFFDNYPTIQSLDLAKKKDLKDLITPLGLANQRSEQLSKLAIAVIGEHGGQIPKTHSELLKLPGVGRYTAGAVMCVAYNQDEAMVDTNVVRVIKRYFGYESVKKAPYTDPKLWEFVKELIPRGKCKEFNLGMIDFANAMCLPKIPKCNDCPLNKSCKFLEKRE